MQGPYSNLHKMCYTTEVSLDRVRVGYPAGSLHFCELAILKCWHCIVCHRFTNMHILILLPFDVKLDANMTFSDTITKKLFIPQFIKFFIWCTRAATEDRLVIWPHAANLNQVNRCAPLQLPQEKRNNTHQVDEMPGIWQPHHDG